MRVQFSISHKLKDFMKQVTLAQAGETDGK